MPRKNGIANNNQDENNDQNVILEEDDRDIQNGIPGGNLNESFDSYIDEEEFGFEYHDNYAQTILREENEQEGPVIQRPLAGAGQPLQQANAAPAAPFAPDRPVLSDIFSGQGEYRHPRAYYKIMYRTLQIFEAAPIADADDKIAFCRYLTALELLADGQAASITRRFPVIGEEMEISMGLAEAWNLVHGKNQNGVRNLDRVTGIPLNGSTLGAIAAQTNIEGGCEQYITASTQYIYARENQPFPGRAAVLEQLPHKYAGNRVFRDPEAFAARLRSDELPPEQSMTAAELDQRIEQLAQPYRNGDGEAPDLDRMTEADRQEYTYLTGIKNWRDVYVASFNSGAFAQNNPEIYEFRKNLSRLTHFKVLGQNSANPAFRSAVKQIDAFMQKAELEISLSEIRQQGETLLQSRRVQRGSGALYAAIKAVGSGDISRFEELVQLDDGYAQLLALSRFASVLQSEIDLAGKGFPPDAPLCEVVGRLQEDPDFLRVSEQHAMDPLFRKALQSVQHLGKKYARVNSFWGSALESARRMDRHLNELTLQKTLAPVSAEQIKNLNAKMGSEGDVRKLAQTVSSNMRKQATLAKFMFLAHLGLTMKTTVDEEGEHSYSRETTPMAELFAHGTHLRFNLPLGAKPEKRLLNQAIFGEDAEKDGIVYWPSTGSYSVVPHQYDDQKHLADTGYLFKQLSIGRGTAKIDLGIGGLGNIGPGGAVISDDGGNGVINMVRTLGDEDRANTIALNIEGAKYGQKSPLGTPSSTRENMNVLSGLMSGKESEENEWREVHLHAIDGAKLTNIVKRFDRYYRDLQFGALTDPAKARKLTELNQTLTGERMEQAELIEFLQNELNIEAQAAQKVVSVTRKDIDEPLPEDADFEIEAPEDPYDGLDEEAIQEFKTKKQNELEGIVLNKLYDDKFVQEEADQNVPGEMNPDPDNSFEYEEEQLEQLNPAPQQAEPETLGQFLTESAERLGTLSRKEQNKLVCQMIDAVNRNKGDLRAAVEPETLDYKRIGKIPSISYQLRHSQRELIDEARKGQIVPLMKGTTELYRALTADQAADDQAIAKLRELYNLLNVPNLAKRTKEYQSMVGAIGRVSAKTKLLPEDKLYVINAVEHYASEKRVVPNSDSGKLSLNYGYEAIKAVAASPEAAQKFLRPLEANITRLQTSMLRKHLITEDRMIRLPAEEQAEANQGVQAQAGQHNGHAQQELHNE